MNRKESNISVWEKIHSTSSWGKYPCEELVRFMGKNFFSVPFEERKKISVLEIGTGQGANVWFLLKENFDVYGFDISPSAIRKLKELLEKMNLLPDDADSRFVVGDMTKGIPFNKKFDIVIDCATTWCSTCSQHFKIYEKVYNTLKPGGFFWIWHILKNSWGYGTGKQLEKDTFDNTTEGPLSDLGTAYYADLCDLIDILKSCGFSIKSKEILTRTYNNVSKQLSFAIIVAKKTE